MIRAVLTAAALLTLATLFAAPSTQLFSVTSPVPVQQALSPAVATPGFLAVRPQPLPRPAASRPSASSAYLLAGGLGFSAVALLATAAEERNAREIARAEKAEKAAREKAVKEAKEQARKFAAAAEKEAKAAKEPERKPAAARAERPKPAERKKRGADKAPPAPPPLTKEQEIEAAKEELRLARLELEEARTKAGKKKPSAPMAKKPSAPMENPLAGLKLPAISLPKGGGSPAAAPPDSDPLLGLAAGAAVGLVPAAALISLRSFLASGRSRRS